MFSKDGGEERLFSINETPNEILEKTEAKNTEESSEDDEKDKKSPKVQVFNKPSSLTEFFCKSFRTIIEKKEEEENMDFERASMRLRRTTSQFGASQIFSTSRPKIIRKNEPVL